MCSRQRVYNFGLRSYVIVFNKGYCKLKQRTIELEAGNAILHRVERLECRFGILRRKDCEERTFLHPPRFYLSFPGYLGEAAEEA